MFILENLLNDAYSNGCACVLAVIIAISKSSFSHRKYFIYPRIIETFR